MAQARWHSAVGLCKGFRVRFSVTDGESASISSEQGDFMKTRTEDTANVHWSDLRRPCLRENTRNNKEYAQHKFMIILPTNILCSLTSFSRGTKEACLYATLEGFNLKTHDLKTKRSNKSHTT